MTLSEADGLLARLAVTEGASIGWTDDSDRWPVWIESPLGLWEARVFSLSYDRSTARFSLAWERLQTDHGMYGEGTQELGRGQALDYLCAPHMTLSEAPGGGIVSWSTA